MRPLCCTAALLLVLVLALTALPDDQQQDEGFVPMFNGKDLSGWVNVNCAPGTFYVKDGEIITTGKPTGYLRTTKQYENFVAEFDWMHVPPKPGEVGNSGFFVWADPIPAIGTGYTRGIEVQVLVNLTYKNKKGEITATSQGDLFSIHGATCVPDRPHPDGWARCLPSENYCKGEREWNHYRVVANDGVIKLAVNGHVVSGLSQCKPRKGYLALESEGSECHFKNLKIKELSSTNPKPDDVAEEDMGFKSLYTGLDLSGWKGDDEAMKHWHAQDTVLHFDGKDAGKDKRLHTEKDYSEMEFIADFRFPEGKDGQAGQFTLVLREDREEAVKFVVAPDGKFTLTAPGGRESSASNSGLKSEGKWVRLHAQVSGKFLSVTVGNGGGSSSLGTGAGHWPAKGTITLRPEGAVDFANLFVRELN
jgi:hypothetical protein